MMSEVDDLILLREFAVSASEPAFATLVERHVSLVYSVALRCVGKPEAAEEVTQAVFILLARKAGSLGSQTILAGWLHHSARLMAANYLRAEIRRQKREQEAFMQSTLNEIETWRQIAPLLDEAISKLGRADRDAIVLRFFENKPLREVGVAMGTSEVAAKMRVNRALDRLRNYFGKCGVGASVVVIANAISANSIQAAPLALAHSVAAIAAAEGAAASASTLTLVEGALKIMAWTKAKIAVATGAALLVATVATTTAIHHHFHAPPSQSGQFNLPTGTVKPKIVYGLHNGLLLAANGSLWSWGEDITGWSVLGLNNPKLNHTVSLRRIGTETDWVDIAASACHCLALRKDGTLRAWGGNYAHQLGDGTAAELQPLPVPSVEGNDWKEVAAGNSWSFAVKKDGTLWAWGDNRNRYLGVSSTNKYLAEAAQVGESTHWAKVWADNLQAVGQQTDGSLWFWGFVADEPDRQAYHVPTRMSPDTNWAEVFLGFSTVFAIKTDGTLWCWGSYADAYAPGHEDNSITNAVQVGAETNWVAGESCGGFYHLLKKRDGNFWAMDAAEFRIVKPHSELPPFKLYPVSLPKDIVAYAASRDDRGCVLTSKGEVWTWGTVIGEYPPEIGNQPASKWAAWFTQPRVVTRPWRLANNGSAN